MMFSGLKIEDIELGNYYHYFIVFDIGIKRFNNVNIVFGRCIKKEEGLVGLYIHRWDRIVWKKPENIAVK